MKKKKASEIFGPVDSELTVIDRGRRGKKRAKTLAEAAAPSPGPYKPQPITEEQWERAQGVICPLCGKEVMQLLPYGYLGLRKACKECIGKREKLLDRRAAILGDKERAERKRKILEYKARIFARRR